MTEPSSPVESPFSGPRADLGQRASAADTVIIASAVVAALYFGREVLVPIAIAVLLSFLLAPLAHILARLRIGRTLSVLVSVALAVAVLAVLGTIIGKQVAQLGEQLPSYQHVIDEKLQAIRGSRFSAGIVDRAAEAIDGFDATFQKKTVASHDKSSANNASENPSPSLLPVEIHQPAPSSIQILQSVVSALLPPLATTMVVIIFMIFILLQRRDLRDRFIGLIGAHDLDKTTRGLNDGASRLSKYFLALTGLNTVFGICVCLGLIAIGVPNPVLWGIAGAALRFIPFLGAPIAAAFPLALAAAVDPGWGMVVETAVLFGVLEIVISQFVEPYLFGHTTGMSPLAIILAAAFWTLIWGPKGLLLSTPITACLVVLGRHVESLSFIELLLSNKPGLSSVQSFYQRILAGDPAEVAYQAETLLRDVSLLDYYEEVALPALALAQRDVARDLLSAARQEAVRLAIEDVVDDLSDHAVQTPKLSNKGAVTELPSVRVLCVPGRTALDQAACVIFAQVLASEGYAVEINATNALSTIPDEKHENGDANMICAVYMDGRNSASIRLGMRRLRKRYPFLPLAVCAWGNEDLKVINETAKADVAIGTLHDLVAFCRSRMNPALV